MPTLSLHGARLRTRCVVAALVVALIATAAIALPPAARASTGVLNPPHRDAGLDTDIPPNGLYDYLVVSVGVRVATAGGFLVLVQLSDGTGTTFIAQGSRLVNLRTGTNVVDVRIPGYAIRQSGFTGPYQAQILLLNDTFAFLGAGLYTTGVYLPTAFEGQPARLAPPHADAGVDMDANLRFDYLAVDAKVNVGRAGTYTVDGVLRDSTGTTFIAQATNTTSLPAGAGSVRLRFAGTDIRVASINGPYNVSLSLVSSAGQQIDTGTHITGTYFLSDFDGLAAAFAPLSPHESFVVDLDGDGFWDNLVVNAFVTVTDPGYYSVQADIAAIPLTSTVRAWLPAGNQLVQLDFLGVDLFNAGVDGPYTVDLTLRDDRSRTLDVDVHTTATYFANDFEPSPPARWIPPFVDSVRDLQGDGLWDELVVNTTVLADRHGTYTWDMELWDSTFTIPIGTTNGEVDLSSGLNPVSLAFPGLWISASGVNGQYGVNLRLFDPEGRQVDLGTFTTAAHLARDFQGPPGRLTRPYFDIGVDRNGDLRLDVIAVDVPITVTRAATFLLGGILIDASLTPVAFNQQLVDLRPGLTTVRLNFSAADAFRTGQDTAFYGVLQLGTPAGGNIIMIGSDTFITGNYSQAPFDQGAIVKLSGHALAAGTGAPLGDIGVTVWSPATRLLRQVATDVSGYYETTFPRGDYYVLGDGASRNAIGTFGAFTSDTVLDITLDPPAANVLTGTISFGDWANATLQGNFTFGADATGTRFQLDIGFGDGDGTLTQGELDRLLELSPGPNLPLTTRDTFTVDGIAYNRVNGTETFTLLGAGPITSQAPLTGRAGAAYTTAPRTVPSSPRHLGRFLTQFETLASSQAFTLGWPANFAMTAFDPVVGVGVTGLGTPFTGIDPAMDPNPRDFVREVWVNLTIGTTDTTPPLVTGAALDGLAAIRRPSGPAVTVTATASDAGRGDWPIQGANFTRGARNWGTAVAMSATDGSFDSPTEAVTGSLATASLGDGSYAICVYARDVVPNNDTTGSCANLVIDNTAPVTSSVRVDGQTAKTVVVGTRVTLTATVSDASTGNGAIAGANFTRGAANWPSSTAMAASDGSFNSPTEAVTASVDTTGWAAAAYDLCVYGRDDVGNRDPTAVNCTRVTVLDRDVTRPGVTGARAVPNPANVSVTVNISAAVTDNIGVTAVYIEILDASGGSVANLTAAFDPATGRYFVERAFTLAGTYTYRVWARDAAGNWGTATGTFTIAAPPSSGASNDGLWWIALVVVAVAVAIVVFLLWTRRRKPAGGTGASKMPPGEWPPTDGPPGTPPTGGGEVDEIDRPLPPPRS